MSANVYDKILTSYRAPTAKSGADLFAAPAVDVPLSRVSEGVVVAWQGTMEATPLSGTRMRLLGPRWQPRHFVVIAHKAEKHWLLYFPDDRPSSKLRGILPLRSFCNAKLRADPP